MFFDIFFLHSTSSSTYILQKFKKYTSEKHFSFQVLAHWNTYTHINNRIYRGFDVKKTSLLNLIDVLFLKKIHVSANWNDEMSIFKESFGIDFFEGHVSNLSYYMHFHGKIRRKEDNFFYAK